MTTTVRVYNNSITYNINYNIIVLFSFYSIKYVRMFQSTSTFKFFIKILNITQYKIYKDKKKCVWQ